MSRTAESSRQSLASAGLFRCAGKGTDEDHAGVERMGVPF